MIMTEDRAGPNVVRDAGFALRLGQACDASVHCPTLNNGRLTWLARQVTSRLKDGKVSPQSVDRWLKGQAKPRMDKNEVLAAALGVDPIWLYSGINQEISPREQRARNAMADGAVNLIAGLIQMDGGVPAFPEEKDTRAKREHIDLYAVIKGTNYAIHVSLAAQREGDWQFTVPAEYENILVLGVVRDGLSFRIIELSEDLIKSHGNATSRAITVTLSDKAVTEVQISGFDRRL